MLTHNSQRFFQPFEPPPGVIEGVRLALEHLDPVQDELTKVRVIDTVTRYNRVAGHGDQDGRHDGQQEQGVLEHPEKTKST